MTKVEPARVLAGVRVLELAELGYETTEIEALRDQGAIT